MRNRQQITEYPLVMDRLSALVGRDAVLLPLRKGSKAPDLRAWEKTTLKQAQGRVYQRMLEDAVRRGGNIGVLLGPASGNLCAIDIDADEEVDRFLGLSPRLSETLRTRGVKGCQLWLRMAGHYPACKVNAGLKLGEGKPVAEWRGGGGHQSVIWGQHPFGPRYHFLVKRHVLEIAFSEIVWPEHWEMRFGAGEEQTRRTGQLALPREQQPPDNQQPLSEERVARIMRYVETIPGAISGSGGSLVTFRLANTLVNGFGLSAGHARAFLNTYNLRCQPPWSDAELAHKIMDALRAHNSKPRGHLWEESREGTFTRVRKVP